MADIFSELDEIFVAIRNLSEKFEYSKYLISKFKLLVISFYYSTVILETSNEIDKIFPNILTSDSVLSNLYSKTIEEAHAIRNNGILFSDNINAMTYSTLKRETIRRYPKVRKLFEKIEIQFNMKSFKSYLRKKEKELSFIDKSKSNLETQIHTLLIENELKNMYDSQSNEWLDGKNLFTMLGNIAERKYYNYFGKRIGHRVNYNRKIEKDFESHLMYRWKIPFNFFEELLELSLISVKNCRSNWVRNNEMTIKHSNLILIHSRAFRICREVFTLLKSGYADGAHARCRTLHELEVICSFLKENSLLVSERYYDFQYIIRFKKLENYNLYAGKLNYEPFSDEEVSRMGKDISQLKEKYEDFKYDNGFGWIPPEVKELMGFKRNQTLSLRHLEKFTGLDHFRPYYEWASDSIHGNSTGFYPLGTDNEKILLIGPTNVGLTDPIHGAALSLMRITIDVLSLNNTLENLFIMHCLFILEDKIGSSALLVDQAIKNDEKLISRNRTKELLGYLITYFPSHFIFSKGRVNPVFIL